jgi:HAMP domain-containing protein
MAETTTKVQLLDALRTTGEQAVAKLRALDAATFERGRYESGWNGREILAHVAAMEWTYARLIDVPRQAPAGESSAAMSGEVRRTTLEESAGQISRYEDAQSAFANLGSDLATYYVLRGSLHADAFELARAQVTQSLTAAREAAPALGDAELARADALASAYATVGETQERILRAVEQNDISGALAIAGQTGVLEAAPKLTQEMQQAVNDARNDLATAQRDDAAEQKRSVALSLGIAGTWAALLLFLGLASFRWLVRPLEKVSLSTLTIAAGDLTARVPENGPRELAQVGADVNRMTEALIRRSEEVNASSRNLEARTSELEEANSALTASEARFRALVQNASDMVTIIDSEEWAVRYGLAFHEAFLAQEIEPSVGGGLQVGLLTLAEGMRIFDLETLDLTSDDPIWTPTRLTRHVTFDWVA